MRKYLRAAAAIALLAFTAAHAATQGGGNDVIYGSAEPFWFWLRALWNNWDGFTL